jgi:putative endonuclease
MFVYLYPIKRLPGWRNWQTCLSAGRRASGGSNMNWFVYAIRSLHHNYIYVGLTSDLEERISRHNSGRERTTRPYRPFVLVHYEVFKTRAEARKREIFLKSGCGKEFIKTLRSVDETNYKRNSINNCPDGETGRRASFRS